VYPTTTINHSKKFENVSSTMASARAALAAGIVIGSSVTILVTIGIKKLLLDKKKTKKVEQQAPRRSIPDDIREEQLSRHTLYFGTEGMRQLRQARICVVGLGGVGSHTAHMLARAGVGYLKLIDFDQVTLSSLNRHACARLSDVGIPKAVCLQRFLQEICPDPNHLHVDVCVEMYTADSKHLLDGKWDMVIDAIDDVPTKAALLSHCLTHDIRVISCMGAAGKSDMTRLHVSDLRTATKDPLASKLRQELKKIMTVHGSDDYLDDMDKLSVIYSSEKTVVGLADFTSEQKEEGFHEFGAVDGMRIRVLPVLGTMPAIMGQSLAAMALTEIGGKPFRPVPGERVGRNVRHKLFQRIKHREDTLTKLMLKEANLEKLPVESGCILNGTWVGPLEIDLDDVEYLMELWRNRCGVTGARLGAVLQLTRWDHHRPGTCDNLVLMSVGAMKKFDDAAEGHVHIHPQIRQGIEKRLASCRRD
jgi:tRNA A37 threonylcarbamoyladenosine dehydratase